MKSSHQYDFVPFQPEYRKDVIGLLQHMWKRPEHERADIFEWKYGKNPLIERPYAYVALWEGKVVGFRGFFPMKFHANGQEFLVLTPSDTIVDPDHRRKGLFSSMTQHAMKEIREEGKIGFFLNLSSNQFSIPGYLKMGWEPVAPEYPMMTRTFTGLLLGKIMGRGFYRKGKGFFNAVDRLFYRLSCRRPKVQGRLEISPEPRHEAMAELAAGEKTTRLQHLRDAAYYEWRCARPFTNYRIAYLWAQDEKLLAYAIFIDKGNGYYILVDYSQNSPEALHALLVLFMKETKANFITSWGFAKDPEIIKAFKKAGFYLPRLHYRLRPRYLPLSFLVRPVDTDAGEEAWKAGGRELRDVESWDLNPIYSDGN